MRHIMYKTPVVVVREHSLGNILDTQTCVGVLAETRSLQLFSLCLLSEQKIISLTSIVDVSSSSLILSVITWDYICGEVFF